MMLDRPAIVQSQQVWICESCGTQDHKSCSCNSTARMEELAARAEHKRQADRDRQRTNRAAARDVALRDAENTEELAEADNAQTIWRRGVINRAHNAIDLATYEDWNQFVVDRELVQLTKQVSAAWAKLATHLEGKLS